MTTTLSELGLDAGGSLVVKKRDVNQLSSGKADSFLLFNHCPFFISVSIAGEAMA